MYVARMFVYMQLICERRFVAVASSELLPLFIGIAVLLRMKLICCCSFPCHSTPALCAESNRARIYVLIHFFVKEI